MAQYPVAKINIYIYHLSIIVYLSLSLCYLSSICIYLLSIIDLSVYHHHHLSAYLFISLSLYNT